MKSRAEPSSRPCRLAPGHGAYPPRGQDEPAGDRGGRFGRMFPCAERPDPGQAAVDELVRLFRKRPQPHSENHAIPAGYTYLGQFVDHDLTFDPISQLGRDNDPRTLVNFRTPRFDLDSVYGSGPADQPFLYEWKHRPDRGVKLLVGGDDACRDLPRNGQGLALIGDARNDENLIVSQLHLLFIRFHNAVVERLRAADGADAPQGEQARAELFERARRIVRWHYQWIVTHDFLGRIAGPVAAGVLRDGDAARPLAPAVDLRHFAGEQEPFMPIEFSGAAYRFGHAMVRTSYVMSEGVIATIFPGDGAEPGDRDLSGFRPLPARLEIDWARFFWTQRVNGQTNSSLKINNRITSELLHVPDRGALPWLNLQRGRALGLPSGPAVADAMGERRLDERELQLDPAADPRLNETLRNQTPLWYYVLCEAGTREFGASGKHLGRVGGRIVAEVLVGLLHADAASYLSCEPAWRPRELPAATAGDFTMIDLVSFVEESEGRRPGAAGA